MTEWQFPSELWDAIGLTLRLAALLQRDGRLLGEVGGEPVVVLAQQRPDPLDVRAGGRRRTDGHPQHHRAAHRGVGQEDLAAVVQALEQDHGGDVGVDPGRPARRQADQ